MMIAKLKKKMMISHFEMIDMRLISYFLGTEVIKVMVFLFF